MSSPRLLAIRAFVTSSSTLAMRLIEMPVAAMIIVLVSLTFYTGKTFAADTNGIQWVKDYAEAKKQAGSSGRPMIIYWTGAPETAGTHKQVPKQSMEQSIEKLQEHVFTQPKILAGAPQFVWVKIDYNKDANANKELGIAENFTKADKTTYRPPSRLGFVFANADGKVYGRLYEPITPTFENMMEGVLKAHSPMDSAIRKIPFQSEMTNYRPYKVPYPGRPKQLEFPPHTQSWRECSKCSEALGKALTLLKQKPDYGFVSNYFAGFAFMMAEGCEKELAQCITAARSQCEPEWGGYSNWKISMSMMLLAEYSIRYGLTPENRVALMTGHQYAAEQVDDGGGWFHHPRQGGVNYAWDISPIGCMYFSAFQEMDALGLDAQPGLTLSRGYVERLSAGWSFGYGTPFTAGRWGSVGKNGLVMMGFYAAGKKNEPFPRMLGDFLTDNPEAPPKAHATGQLPFFGAGMGNHLMGPEHYAKYAGYWLHPLIDCQKSDGGIAQLPHDDTEARSGMPPEKVLEEVKSSSKSDYSATAVLASLILMTEPGAYSGKAMVKGPLVAKNKKSSTTPSVQKVAAKLPVASAENVLLWDAKLKTRAGALVKEDVYLVTQLKATNGSVKVLSIVEDKVTVRLESGGQGEVPWKLFQTGDKLSLALAIAAVKDTPEDHALSAFYLLLDGNAAKADLHLKRAGQHAADVLTVFGMKAP